MRSVSMPVKHPDDLADAIRKVLSHGDSEQIVTNRGKMKDGLCGSLTGGRAGERIRGS